MDVSIIIETCNLARDMDTYITIVMSELAPALAYVKGAHPALILKLRLAMALKLG